MLEVLAYIAIAFQLGAAIYMLAKRRQWRKTAREHRALLLALHTTLQRSADIKRFQR